MDLIREDLLHYIWQHKILLGQPLHTTDGQKIEVIHPGQLNNNAGPDFFNARIRLDETTWAGNIEIHIRSSDWKRHKHQLDRAYDNVILHVVLVHDEPVFYPQQQVLPTLELNNLLPGSMLKVYYDLQQSKSEIPCTPIFQMPDDFLVQHWLERLSVERLEHKYKHIQELLLQTNQHWEEVFYRMILRYFGQNTNALPFELLAQQVSFVMIQRNRNSLVSLQAILLGVSGFLHKKFKDQYLQLLAREYQACKTKFNLIEIDKSVWKFGRMRPANFPTVRLLQLAQLFHQSDGLFKNILAANDINEIMHLFHIQSDQLIALDDLHKAENLGILKSFSGGKDLVNSLLINVVLPILFAYGKNTGDEKYCVRALNGLNQLKAESNHITQLFKKLNIIPNSAKQSQALIALNKYYCSQHQCLRCTFGNFLLKNQ